MTTRPEWPLWALTALGIIAAVVLTLASKTVPPELWAVLGLTGGGGAALTLPQTVNRRQQSQVTDTIDNLAATSERLLASVTATSPAVPRANPTVTATPPTSGVPPVVS